MTLLPENDNHSHAMLNTKARRAILTFLQTHTDRQFTVEDIAAGVASSGEKIPQATIYRTLDFFAEQKLVHKFVTEDGSRACYQGIPEGGDCSAHYHLKCCSCGKLIHLDCDTVKAFTQHMELEHGFVIDLEKTVLYGICVACREKA